MLPYPSVFFRSYNNYITVATLAAIFIVPTKQKRYVGWPTCDWYLADAEAMRKKAERQLRGE